MSRSPLCHAIRRVLLAVALVGTAPFALAQQAPPAEPEPEPQAPGQQPATTTLDRIEVTGSNIRRTDTETASPVQVVTRQEIERTGKATVAEYLQTLTADGSGSVPKTFGAGFAGGSAAISLRGLGAGSTLVLLNGRRMAPFGLADDGQKVFTDLSTIPMEAVERVEVLKDGASSIYGSDAIAGVVNIILRKDFTGAVAKASYGISGDSDGDTRKASLTLGTGDLAADGFNFFVNIEGSKSDRVAVSDRRNRKWIGTGDIRRWGYDPYSFGGLAGGIDGSGGATGSLVGNIERPDGTFTSLPGCAPLPGGGAQDANGGCFYDTSDFTTLTPEDQSLNFFARGTFALSDASELYTEFGFAKKSSFFQTTPTRIDSSWGYPGGAVNSRTGEGAIRLGVGHPDNPYGVPSRIRYVAGDVGPRAVDTDNEFFRFLAGVKGQLGEWDYDIGYLHSQTDLVQDRNGFLRYSAVQTVLSDPDSPVGYWNIGQGAEANSQALYDFISPTISASASSKLDAIDMKASRSLMDLPGGSLGLALGAEYRRQSAELKPVTYTDTGDIIGLGYSAYDGDQNVAAAYAELLAPVATWLELSGAVRVDSYEGGETATTPKVGFKLKPADWIAIRGTYAEGFRAPNPAETAGSSVGFATTQDPVRCALNATNCSLTVGFINQPNPDLEAEESKSYTLGLVLQPTDSTTLTVDAWEIKRSNEITTESLDTAIEKGNVVRGDDLVDGQPGTGTLLLAYTPYINATSTTVRGLDLDVRQSVDLEAWGKLRFDLQWSRMDSYELEETDGVTTEYAGTHGNCNVTNCIGTPKDRINFGATWEMDRWSVSGVVNYIGPMDNTFEEGGDCAAWFGPDPETGEPAPDGCEIPSFYTVDLSATWQPSDAWEIFGSVQNATDRVAPLDPTTYGALNYNPLHFSGALGRFYTLGVKYSFQ